jgi:hypothetical protein
MRFVFAAKEPGRIEFGIIYGLIALLALFAARFLPILELAPACAFKALTGLPCPTCGSTRSIVHLSHFRFFSSLAMNPLLFVSFLAAVVALLYGVITLVFGLPRINVMLSDREKDRVRAAALLVLLFNWLYLFFAL